MGHLVELHETYGDTVAVIGVTDAPADEVRAFREEHGATYHLLADARVDREAYGISAIWGNQVYLVDPTGTIVAEGSRAVDERLAAR